MDSDSKLLRDLRRTACRVDLDTFRRLHAGLYLLATMPFEDNEFDFTTAVVDDPMAAATQMLSGDADALLSGKVLAQVTKSDRNPWRSRITVGRAPNNDLILRHPSISKLHAYFERRRGPGGEDAFGLLDPGSSNGTRVNARRLPPDEPVPVSSGDLVILGDVECELLDAAALHETIRALFPTPDLLPRL